MTTRARFALPTPARRSTRRSGHRLVATLSLAAALIAGSAAAAQAHVHVDSDSTASGSFSELAFRVPNESATASTVKVSVELPTDKPFLSVSARPLPGWDVSLTKAPLPKPMTVDGTTVTKAVRTVTWTARPGTQIGPDQYQEFDLSVGPLPSPGLVLMPATQTMSDGSVVHWDQPTPASGVEPEHPAPSFTVTAATVALWTRQRRTRRVDGCHRSGQRRRRHPRPHAGGHRRRPGARRRGNRGGRSSASGDRDPAVTVRPAGATGHAGTWRPVAALTSALLVLLGSAVTLVVAAGPAAAHDVLVSTSPANGSTVAQTPSKIVLTFTDPALSIGTQMVVTGPAGSVTVPKPRLVDNTVVQDLPGSSPAGRYTVLWRVTSADGHPVSGQISFTSRAASAAKASRDDRDRTGR